MATLLLVIFIALIMGLTAWAYRRVASMETRKNSFMEEVVNYKEELSHLKRKAALAEKLRQWRACNPLSIGATTRRRLREARSEGGRLAVAYAETLPAEERWEVTFMGHRKICPDYFSAEKAAEKMLEEYARDFDDTVQIKQVV